MAIDVNDEIVQDFLVEAGEILEKLSVQLVELEKSPTDSQLLNAIFRSFHTIKGGASFLNLVEIVEICHSSEDIFNVLRQGARKTDAPLMDAILKVVDYLNEMFNIIRAGGELKPANHQLLEVLKNYAVLSNEYKTSKTDTNSTQTIKENKLNKQEKNQAVNNSDEIIGNDITDEEFEKILDAIEQVEEKKALNNSDEISAEEFERLLVEIQLNKKIGTQKIDSLEDQKSEIPIQNKIPQPLRNVAEHTDVKVVNNEKIDSYNNSNKPNKQANKDHNAAVNDNTVRVDTRRLDDIMNMVGELVLVRNRLVTLENTLAGNDEVSKAIGNLDVVTANLQSAVMKTRMQPIKKVFSRFPRVVRDLARSLNKEVVLELIGEETDLDKNLVEALADPLVHLVRNAVDHGIEKPDERLQKGKPQFGTIRLSAEQEGDHILLTIEDDGAGIDAEVIRNKAIEKGVLDPEAAARLDEKECFNLIFLPGFSTKAQITDISGRGVGMDVVKTRISQLNGTIDIDSKINIGSRFLIKVPLTLAILPTLMVILGNQTFALPLVSVSEIFNLDLSKTNNLDGQLVIMVRDKAMPLFYLRNWLVNHRHKNNANNAGHVVVVNVGMQKVGFVVDQLIGQEEVVIKPLGALLHGTPGLAGATITGDGRIALILDVPGLMKAYVRRM